MTTIRTRITALLLCVLLLGGAAPAGILAFAEDVPEHEHVFGGWEYEDAVNHRGWCTAEKGCKETILEKHEYIEDKAQYVAPTEFKEGKRVLQCKCGDIKIETVEKLPHTEHDYDGEYFYPTCEEDAYTVYTCSICGDSYTVTVPGTAIGHDWDEGTVLDEPRCLIDGERIFICKNNPTHTRTETIPATGHSFGAWEVTTAPTCVNAGVETRTCSACSTTETRNVAATGVHSFGAWEVTVQPTETAPGEQQRVCSACGSKETQSIDPLPAVPLTLNKTEVSLRAKASEKLTVVTPADTKVTWTSSNAKVARVAEDGTITAVRRGTAIITAHTVEGDKTAECKVSVHYELWQWIIIIVLFGWIWYLK